MTSPPACFYHGRAPPAITSAWGNGPELRFVPGSGVPPHTHAHEDEAFYVLAGEIILDSADRPAPLRLGAGHLRSRQRDRIGRSTTAAAQGSLQRVKPGPRALSAALPLSPFSGTPTATSRCLSRA